MHASIAIETEAQKQNKGMEFLQKDCTDPAAGTGGPFFTWFCAEQAKIATMEDLQERQLMAMKMAQRVHKKLASKKYGYQDEYLGWLDEIMKERQLFWRGTMLDQQIAYERNEIRCGLMTSDQRDAMRKKQVEIQYAQMAGQTTQDSQQDTDAALEADLSGDVKESLDKQVKVRTMEVRRKFLPASEIASMDQKKLENASAELEELERRRAELLKLTESTK